MLNGFSEDFRIARGLLAEAERAKTADDRRVIERAACRYFGRAIGLTNLGVEGRLATLLPAGN